MISEHNIEIRFADIDAMGHVNNAVYLSYFEQARIHYFSKLGGAWDWKSQGVLLAKNLVEYKLPILLTDHVVIKTKCIHMGGKSLTFSYLVQKMVNGEAILVLQENLFWFVLIVLKVRPLRYLTSGDQLFRLKLKNGNAPWGQGELVFQDQQFIGDDIHCLFVA